nr:receptor-like protein kinase FERONIA [Quercus suber]POF07448.1 receptor-like protein kinase feronia [Quercus suber]
MLIYYLVRGLCRVYKGFIDDRTINIAIKDADFETSLDELTKEVVLLCQLRHPNLTCLIGYGLNEDKGFLVYEFIANGNLGNRLTNHDEPLPWKQRLRICFRMARGLHYLHTGLKHNIIHREVKPRNIMLDEKLEAKLTDLGLPKLGPPSLSKVLIRVKSEVVGVLSARKARDIKLTKEQKFWVTWARKCIEEGTINQIIDLYLMAKVAPECFKLYVDIVTSCVQNKGKDRPVIGEVELILEHALELQERADATRNDVDQYNYPIVECNGSASLPESEESI